MDGRRQNAGTLLNDMDGEEFLLEAASRKVLALPFPEQAVFLLYYGFHMNDSQISEVLALPYAHGMRIGMLNTLQAWASTPEVFQDPEAISKACKIAIKRLTDEVNMQPDILHAYSRHFRKQLRKVRAAQKPVDYLLRGASRAAAVLKWLQMRNFVKRYWNGSWRHIRNILKSGWMACRIGLRLIAQVNWLLFKLLIFQTGINWFIKAILRP